MATFGSLDQSYLGEVTFPQLSAVFQHPALKM